MADEAEPDPDSSLLPREKVNMHRPGSMALGDDPPDRLGALDADELLVQAVVEVAQALGVEAELVEDGGVQVLDVEAVGGGRASDLVGLADAHPALDAAAGHPHGESEGVVVAAGALGVLGRGLA